MTTVREITSGAITELIESYKPVGNRLDTLESTIENLSGMQINILDFPRVVPEVDDTGSFNRAINKVINDQNYNKQFWRTPIRISPGRYTVKDINIDGARVAIVGSGIEGCVIEPALGAAYIFKIDNTATAGSASVEGIRFSSFLSGGLGGAWTGTGIVLGQNYNYNEGEIKNCWFALGDLAMAIGGRAWDSRIHNCWFDSNNIGIQLTGDSNRVKIDKCSFYNNKVHDIKFDLSPTTQPFAGNGYHKVTDCSFIGGEGDMSTCTSISALYAQRLQIDRCDWDTPYGKSLRFYGCTDVTISNSDLYDEILTSIDEVKILTAATTSGNVTVTLNGTAFNIAVTAADTITQVASKIRDRSYPGWTTSGADDTVRFTRNTTGKTTVTTFNGASTGVTANIRLVKLGSDNYTKEQIIFELCSGILEMDKVKIFGGKNDLINYTNTPNMAATVNVRDSYLVDAVLSAIDVYGQVGSAITLNIKDTVIDRPKGRAIMAGESGLKIKRLTMDNVTVKNAYTGSASNGEGIRVLADGGYIKNSYFENVTGKQAPHINILFGAKNIRVTENDFKTTASGGLPIVNNGTSIVLEDNFGYKTENNGIIGFNGDGTTKNFTLPHGLISTPNNWNVTPNTAAAIGSFSVTADATNLYINFTSAAPPTGTNNVIFVWLAKV